MNDRIKRRYDKFGREITFFNDNKTDFAPAGEAAKRAGNLVRIVQEMDDAKAGQGGGSATPKEVLLDSLQLDLGNIHRIAAAIAQDEPGFADDFRTAENSESSLTTAGDKYLAQFQPADGDTAAQRAAKTALIARFVAHELPATFVDDLQGDLEDIAAAHEQLQSGDQGSVENTAALGRLARAGMKESTDLDAILRAKYTRNADQLRGRESASHLERTPVRAKKTPPPTPPPK
jgi:hypothetical protein